MPPPSKIDKLPVAVRRYLDKALEEANFSGYQALEAELGRRGFDISKSALHRHGQALKKALDGIRIATEGARIMAEQYEDEGDERTSAIAAMLQADYFNLLVELAAAETTKDPAERAKILGNVSHAIANLSRSTLPLKKWQKQLTEKAATVAQDVEKVARANGLSADAVAVIRASILGISP